MSEKKIHHFTFLFSYNILCLTFYFTIYMIILFLKKKNNKIKMEIDHIFGILNMVIVSKAILFIRSINNYENLL